MKAHPYRSIRLNQLVMFIITCAVLWTQFFGLSHTINHGWNATYPPTSLNHKNSTDRLTQIDAPIDVSDNSPANSPVKHNCFAWDSCSLSSAVFLSGQTQFTNTLLSFCSITKPLTRLSSKLTQFFLSRAPPNLLPH
jgi:hypothetical protein